MINDLRWVKSTGIDSGVRWGVALMDPSIRSVVNAGIGGGHVPGTAAGRPLDYVSESPSTGSIKYLIIMTDGDPDGQRVYHPAFRQNPKFDAAEEWSPIWYDSQTGKYSLLLRGGYLADFPYDQISYATKLNAFGDSPSSATWQCRDPWDGNPGQCNLDNDALFPDNPAYDPTATGALPAEIDTDRYPGGRKMHRISRVAANEHVDDRCHPVWYHVNEGSRPGTFALWPHTAHMSASDYTARNDFERIAADGTFARLSWPEVWARFSRQQLREYVVKLPRQKGWFSEEEVVFGKDIWGEDNFVDKGNHTQDSAPHSDYNDTPGHNDRMLGLCALARGKGMNIYSIAFATELISES